MYSLIEIEKLMRDRDRFKREWYNSNLTLAGIRKKSPDIFIKAKEKQAREKQTIENLLRYIKKRGGPLN